MASEAGEVASTVHCSHVEECQMNNGAFVHKRRASNAGGFEAVIVPDPGGFKPALGAGEGTLKNLLWRRRGRFACRMRVIPLSIERVAFDELRVERAVSRLS